MLLPSVADKKNTMAKIDGKKNPPDILTKFGERSMLDTVSERLWRCFRVVRDFRIVGAA